MKRDDLHRNLLRALENKIPDKTELVEILMKLLFMEKGAIYRRLRGEVPFSFYEVMNIIDKLNIPLYNIIYTFDERIDRFEMNIKSTNMDDMDYKHWEDYVSLISTAKNDPNSEIAESSNVLPLSIYPGFDSLLKYFLFKYQYMNNNLERRISFNDLVIPDRLNKIIKGYFRESKYFSKTIYIWDYSILRYLVDDIQYFSGINLISADDIQKIRKDLFALIDYIERIAKNGCFEETGNPVSLYASDINIDAIYSYMQFNDLYVSLVRIFILNSVVSTVHSSFMIMKNWIQSLIKSSVLITQSGALYRAEFFDRQRKIIEKL